MDHHQNTQPTTSPLDRTLRAITILTFLPTFCFMLPYAILANRVVEPLGMIPAAFSGVYGLLRLLRDRANKATQNRWRLVHIFADAFLAVMTLAFLMAIWIDLPYSGRWRGGQNRLTMVGTYGTFGLMANFVIHVFLSLRDISHIMRDGLLHRSCPHCHHDLSAPLPSFRRQIILTSGPSGSGSGRGSKESYYYPPPLAAQYDEDARESTEILSTCPPTTERFSAETLRSSQRDGYESSEESGETVKLVEA